MSLVTAVETLQRRPCTADEISMLSELQSIHRIDDDDPLIVVLALMARSQLIVGTLPDLLQQKATETIELHRTVLREQSIVISKELISVVAEKVQGVKLGWFRYVSCFIAGMVFAAVMMSSLRHFITGG